MVMPILPDGFVNEGIPVQECSVYTYSIFVGYYLNLPIPAV